MLLNQLLRQLGIYKIYEKWLNNQIKAQDKPQHIGIILDGNRRWALKRALPTLIGHKEGVKRTQDVLDWCYSQGIETVTIYAFSTENFNRPKKEVEDVLNLINNQMIKLISNPTIHENQVKIKAIGRIDLLPVNLQKSLNEVERVTEKYNDHFLNIAVAYGGRKEIIDATKKIVEDVTLGKKSLSQINETTFDEYLYTAHLPNPHPDLIIRTSGESRLSGFLLWQSAYSEFLFLDVYWPDFRKIDLLRVIRMFQQRKRRYGK